MNETAATSFATLLVFALYAFHFGSIIWMGLDARKRDFSNRKFASKTWQWVVGGIFIWIIVFPVYLFKRGSAPLKVGWLATAARGERFTARGWGPTPVAGVSSSFRRPGCPAQAA